MKLSDIMGYANLAIYAEVAMVLFMLVFLAVAVRLFLPGRQQSLHDAAQLPFNDDPTTTATPHRSTHG